MNHINFASLGMLMIGLVATGTISWITLQRISETAERLNAYRWSATFGFSICSLMSIMPLLGQNQLWILLLPFAGTWLSLDSLHRIGEGKMDRAAKPISGETKIA